MPNRRSDIWRDLRGLKLLDQDLNYFPPIEDFLDILEASPFLAELAMEFKGFRPQVSRHHRKAELPHLKRMSLSLSGGPFIAHLLAHLILPADAHYSFTSPVYTTMTEGPYFLWIIPVEDSEFEDLKFLHFTPSLAVSGKLDGSAPFQVYTATTEHHAGFVISLLFCEEAVVTPVEDYGFISQLFSDLDWIFSCNLTALEIRCDLSFVTGDAWCCLFATSIQLTKLVLHGGFSTPSPTHVEALLEGLSSCESAPASKRGSELIELELIEVVVTPTTFQCLRSYLETRKLLGFVRLEKLSIRSWIWPSGIDFEPYDLGDLVGWYDCEEPEAILVTPTTSDEEGDDLGSEPDSSDP